MTRTATLLLATLVLGLSGVLGCDDDPADPDDAGTDAADADLSDADSNDGSPDGDADGDAGPEIDPNPDCDPLVPTLCALPWPSNLFLEETPETVTGYTVAFGETTLPHNNASVHPDPTPFRRLDGYSVGTAIMTHFPGVDARLLPDELAIDASIAEDAPILLLEVLDDGLRRVPSWAEIDLRADSDEEAILFVRPAEILQHGTRYVIAFRGLVDGSGEAIEPSPAFRRLRDGEAAEIPTLAPRIAQFEEVFTLLADAGVARDSLILAWDFVTTSAEAAQGDMLAIRNQAYDLVGSEGPELTITDIEEFAREDDGSGLPVDEEIAHRIHGTFRVPDFTVEESDGAFIGHVINRDADGAPTQNGWREPTFVAMIPHPNGEARPLELMEYGHGLTGTYNQVFAGHNQRVAYEHGFIYFGASLTGFSSDDVPIILSVTADLSRVEWFTERMHQGVAEYVLLARGMRERFAALPEIAALGHDINSDVVYYSGISQGGIYGASVVALSQEMTRGHLGVPGNNYGLLLERSVDFAPYMAMIEISYRERMDFPVLLEAVYSLWQKTDPVSYYRNITAEPFPDTPVHHVLLAQAQYDWQVAPLANEIAVRSGAEVALMDHYGRDVPLVEPTPYPHVGSALVNYSFGDPWAPPGNLPPPETDNGDPHSKGRDMAHHNEQLVHFLRTGEVIDVCDDDGCTPE